jgi:hypothetical protein
VPNVGKYRYGRDTKDELHHEHLGKARRPRTILDHRNLTLAVSEHIRQFPLAKPETAPQNTHQVVFTWRLVLHIRNVLSPFSSE